MSCRGAWSTMVKELAASRELIWRLLWRDFIARYRQSVLGYVWALVPPIATVCIFTYLSSARILSLGTTSMPYPAFVLIGLVIWQFFAGGVLAATGSLVKADVLVSKIRFPRETLVLASLGPVLFELPVRMVLVAAVFAWFGVVPPLTVCLVPLVLLPVLLLSLGVGFVAAIANGLVRDLEHSLPFILLLAMFATSVVYPPPETWPWVVLNDLNPVGVLIGAARDWATLGHLSRPSAVVAAWLVCILVFLVGWRAFHLAESYIVERI